MKRFIFSVLGLRILSKQDYEPSNETGSPGHWKTAVLGGFASYIDSAVIVAGGTAWVLYQDVMKLSSWDIGALSAILTFALAIGAAVGGRLGDRFGRKRVFSIDLLVLAFGLLVLMLAPSAAFLYAGVVIAGLAIGADIPVSLALIAEEAPPDQRSRLVAFSQVLWLLGIVSSLVLSFLVSDLGALGARILFAHVFVVAIVIWVLRRTLPESRQWSSAVERVDHLGSDQIPVHHNRAKDLIPFTVPMLATACFYTFNNLSANTMGQFQTFLFVNVADVSVTKATFIGVVGIPIGLLANVIFMRIAPGPKRMTGFVVGSFFLVSGFTIPLVLGFNFTTLTVATIFSGFGGGLAGEAIYKVWSQELFPTLVRGSAQGSTIFVTRTITAAFAFVTPAIADASPRLLMGLLVGLNLAAALTGYFWVRKLPKATDVEDSRVSVPAR